ncbi:uncharacterized protein LOC141717970 [Apium graveolens]|uniref:uncharacterized protein LOC141717970 n=1 Tax=Apium graveolens TaxID=4045 RepID=UPI003D7972BB
MPLNTKHCWNATNIPTVIGESNSFGDWLQLVFSQINLKSIQMSNMVCWMLWKNRNDLVWNLTFLVVSEVLNTTLSVLNQWRFVKDKTFDHTLGLLNLEDGRTKWQAPSMNRVKVNTDAVLFDNPSRYCHAQVVRDHNGKLVEAMSHCYLGSVSPELAEVIGIREALSWVKNASRNDVVVETDCLTLIRWIRSSYITMSYLGRVMEDRRRLLVGLQEQNVMLRFVKRSANSVVHYLARYNFSIADCTWILENAYSEFDYTVCIDSKQ